MEIKRITLGSGNEYIFACVWRNTRSGFAHDCTLFAYDEELELGSATVRYLNRTWERYEFQTVMKKALDAAIADYRESFQNDFMRLNGYKRMTKEREQELEADFRTTPTFRELEELRQKI